MDAIIKNENVYIVIRDKETRDGIDIDNIENLIVSYRGKGNNTLYGGRVTINNKCQNGLGTNKYRINIDGIDIIQYEAKYIDSLDSNDAFSLEKIAAVLNQIENLGVDSFLENYKIRLQEIKKEFEGIANNLQNELTIKFDSNKNDTLRSIREIILKMSCLIFSLLINMNAGLNNQHYTNAYDTIINMYF